jgi:hypothetical protein
MNPPPLLPLDAGLHSLAVIVGGLGQAMAPLTCIREVSGSNLSRNIDYTDWKIFVSFLYFLQGNSAIISGIRYRPHRYQLYFLLIILKFDDKYSERPIIFLNKTQ